MKPGASSVITSGIANPISKAATSTATLIVPSTRPANAAAATVPCSPLTRSHAGTNAAFSAPSVSNRLMTLTIWNATRNASAIGPAPSNAATIASRAKPSSREANVPEETVMRLRSIVVRAVLAGVGGNV